MSDQKNRPAETLRDGNLKAAIWENIHEDRTTHTVQFRRAYRGSDGQLRETDTFFGNDLLRLSRLAEKSYDALGRLRDNSREQTREKAREETPRRSRSRDRDRERDQDRDR